METTKRACIGSTSNTLIFHLKRHVLTLTLLASDSVLLLKPHSPHLACAYVYRVHRFDLNYDTFQHQKVNSRFAFPMEINLACRCYCVTLQCTVVLMFRTVCIPAGAVYKRGLAAH